MKSIFSIDVEDWYHISGLPNTPELPDWETFPPRIEKNFMHLMDIFSRKSVHVTCFFLGWIAQRFPRLVKEAKDRGHEIASHGYSHKLTYEMGKDEFLQDVKNAKNIIEDISGTVVSGYRAPGFSVTKDTPWFFDKLIEAGYKYDSSVFPAARVFGGIRTDRYAPYAINNGMGRIIEFPVTAIRILGKPFCFFGGGYLRLSPYFLIRYMGMRVINKGRPVVFYIHPREIDPEQPHLQMRMRRKFNSYVNIRTTENKLVKILDQFDASTFSEFIAKNKINGLKQEGG